MELNNKTAIVTGARRGIGKAIALSLAEAGAKVVVSDLDRDDCQEVVEEIETKGGTALASQCDVSKQGEINSLIEKTKEEFGGVDILVNNAGIFIQKPIEEMTKEEIDDVIDINLKGVINFSKAVVDEMKENGGGKIVNIASIAGLVGFGNSSTYCASKGGIVNLTRELALELGESKINVNAIAPGVIETEMTEGMLSDPDQKKNLLAQIPYGRVGKPEDIANAATFLASPKADYITGAILNVDGGWLSH